MTIYNVGVYHALRLYHCGLAPGLCPSRELPDESRDGGCMDAIPCATRTIGAFNNWASQHRTVREA